MRFQLSSTLATAILVLASGITALSDDQQNALNIHNQARAAHGIAPLSWDDGLAAGAQDWANQLTGIGHLQHSQAGENLYWQSWTSGDALARGAQAWVDEAPNYHGEPIGDGDFESYGHYSKRPPYRTYPH